MERIPMDTFHRLTLRSSIPAAALLVLWGQPSRVSATTTADEEEPSVSSASAHNEPAQPSLRKWLDALSFAESGNRPWIVHRDRDGRDYHGCLQFREKTFRYFVDKFNLAPKAETNDVM